MLRERCERRTANAIADAFKDIAEGSEEGSSAVSLFHRFVDRVFEQFFGALGFGLTAQLAQRENCRHDECAESREAKRADRSHCVASCESFGLSPSTPCPNGVR